MYERRERKKRTCIEEKRTINKIGLIISNILEKLSRLIIQNRGMQTTFCPSRKKYNK
jgi:hypothetical protein